PAAALHHTGLTHRVFTLLESSPVPVVAAVAGAAVGGGFELTMACDLVVADPRASFRLPEVGLGLIPGAGGTQRLSRLVGQRRALEYVLLGMPLRSAQALEAGVVNLISADG